MNTWIAILAGGCYSAAFVAPKPWCIVALFTSALLVSYMRLH